MAEIDDSALLNELEQSLERIVDSETISTTSNAIIAELDVLIDELTTIESSPSLASIPVLPVKEPTKQRIDQLIVQDELILQPYDAIHSAAVER